MKRAIGSLFVMTGAASSGPCAPKGATETLRPRWNWTSVRYCSNSGKISDSVTPVTPAASKPKSAADEDFELAEAGALAEQQPHASGRAIVQDIEHPEENDANYHIDTEWDWKEPGLTDLDVSVPQVNIQWMAAFVEERYHYKSEQWAIVEKKRAEFPGGLEEAKKLPSIHFMSDKEFTDEEVEKLKEEERKDREEFKKKNISKALIEGLSYDDGTVIIDCRTMGEATSWGMIEGAKLLPSHDFWEAWQLHPALFEQEFGFPKPKQYDSIVFYCQYGPRSLMAAQIAIYMGWRNVKHFRDGFYNWHKQFNRVIRAFWEHDEKTGNDRRRQAQLIVGREIARDIAPELNVRVQLEADALRPRLDRSRGSSEAMALTGPTKDPKRFPVERLLTDRSAGVLPLLEPGYKSPVSNNHDVVQRSKKFYPW